MLSTSSEKSVNDTISRKEFEKYNSKGLTGMANLGNTCYFNAIDT